jgi:hypothetical protein
MMRYERKVAILGGSLAALLAIWGAGAIFSPERNAARAESRKLLLGKAEDAASLELGSPKLSLAKEGGAWYLLEGGAKLPAQESRIKSFLEALAAVKSLKPMAKTQEAWKSLELDEGKAKPVLVKDGKGKAMADFAIGGFGPTGGEVYLRLAGSEASFSAEGSFASYAASSRASWLDLRVLPGPLPESDVEALALKAGIALDGVAKPKLVLEYGLRRQPNGWAGVPGLIDPVAVSALLRSLLNLEGEDMVAAPPAGAFSPVAARIELSLGNGGSKVLEVGAQAGEGRFYIRLAGRPYVYTVSAYGLRNALKAPADLLVKK